MTFTPVINGIMLAQHDVKDDHPRLSCKDSHSISTSDSSASLCSYGMAGKAHTLHPPIHVDLECTKWHNHITLVTIFLSLKNMLAAMVNPKWAKFSELLKMTHLLVLVSGLKEYLWAFKLMTDRLIAIGERSGTKFLVLYMKQCIRLVLAFLNNQKITPQKGDLMVGCGKSGLPLVIPGILRRLIVSFRELGTVKGRLVTRAVLTVLRFNEVLQFKALPDLSTITGGFTGIGASFSTLELRTVLRLFKFPTGGLPGLTWTVSESAGPNGPKATWFAGADAVALLFHPSNLYGIVMFGILTRRFSLVLWLILIQIICLPALPIL